MSYQCVPLYDSLGENAIEYIVNHSESVLAFVDTKKLPMLAKAIGGIGAQFKHVIYWGSGDEAAVQVR
jgi:long-chain acyl-CoA synthetase